MNGVLATTVSGCRARKWQNHQIQGHISSWNWPGKSQRSFLTEWEVMPGTYAWCELEDPEPGQEGNECPPRWPSEVLVTDR